MKKFLLLAAALVVGVVAMNAQDVLTKHNGEDLKVIVKEIDANNVKYVLFSEPQGVLYSIPKSEILIIRYASGRNEVFGNKYSSTPTTHSNHINSYSAYQQVNYGMSNQIRVGMKYDELKHIYDYRMYRGGYERYSPVWCGVGSFFIPGLGQMICGEAARGLGHLFLSVACNVVSIVGIYEQPELTIISSLANLGIGIWSIVDASRVAKVKNMYENDLRSLRSDISIDMYPSLNPMYSQSGFGVAPSMTLAITF